MKKLIKIFENHNYCQLHQIQSNTNKQISIPYFYNLIRQLLSFSFQNSRLSRINLIQITEHQDISHFLSDQIVHSTAHLMIPVNSSPHKTILKTFFDSNHNKNVKCQTNQTNQVLKKQKSISFYGSFTPSYLKTPKENLNYPTIDQDTKRSLTPKFQLKSPNLIKNELLKFRQEQSQQKKNMQSLTNRKYSQINISKYNPKQNIEQLEMHTKREFVENRTKRFQSLRSTINTSNSNLVNHGNSVSKKVNQQQQSKSFQLKQVPKGKYFTLHFDKVKEKNNNQLKVGQSNNLNYSPSDRSLDKKPFKFTSSNSNLHQGSFQCQNFSQPLPKKESQVHLVDKNVQTGLQTKKQNKVPSFLNAKNLKKNQQNTSFKPKQFPKFFPLNVTNCQKISQQKKVNEKKVLLSNKHAKSFSVFQTFDFCKKDDQKNKFSSTSQSFHPGQKVNPSQPRFIYHQLTQSKSPKINVAKPKQKFMRISPTFENRSKIGSSSLRQSLTKGSTLKQSCSIERLNFDKKQALHEILPITFQLLKNQKQSLESFKKTMHNSEVVNESQLSSSRKLSEENHGKSNVTENKSIIDDIKETLIGCDLLSQQDYQNVIQKHKNDILKPQKSNKTNDTCKVNFSIDLSLDKRTSIKTSSQEEIESRFSSEQEKKLAELAEMCQQKRSKWILEQTDTIKQSLKQLSEYNTEKSLYDNEWKKISIKDFSTSRNNRVNPNRFKNIDEVKQQDINSSQKDHSKLSSIRVLSQNCVDQIQELQTQIDKNERFKKNKQKSLKIVSSLEMIDDEFQCSNKDIERCLSLEDFEILWSAQQQILLTTSAGTAKSIISYRAKHKPTNFIYTIKKVEKNILKNEGEQFISKFIKSLKLQFFTLNNPFIQKLYAIFDDRYSIYLVCEFTQQRLSQVLSQEKKEKDNSKNLTLNKNSIKNEQNKAIFFKKIIDGMQEIHLNHIVHKNIHPNSIRIVFGTCKISGFSEAEMIDTPIKKLCNQYICPQALFDSTKLAMDIWCLGILAYQLLIGKKPFNDQSQDSTKKVKKILQCSFDIPLQKASLCKQFFNSALRRNPKDRFSIFELKNIWTRKLKEQSFEEQKNSSLLLELQKLFKV